MFIRISTLFAAAVIARNGIPFASAAVIRSPQVTGQGDLYIPDFELPNASSKWTVEQPASITWDKTMIDPQAPNIAFADLYSANGNNFIAHLAQNFSPLTGSVSFLVPDVPAGQYYVELGEVGHDSQTLTIVTGDGDIYIPDFIAPNANTIWANGETVQITWNAGSVAPDAPNLSFADLYLASDNSFVAHLAQNFPATTGQVTVEIPVATAPGYYYIALGETGHNSATFQVVETPSSGGGGDNYIPDFQTPNSGTTWTVGQTASITWDVTSIAPEAPLVQFADLYASDNTFVAHLATDFSAQTGSVDFTVPTVAAGAYFIALGEIGHDSQTFHIVTA